MEDYKEFMQPPDTKPSTETPEPFNPGQDPFTLSLIQRRVRQHLSVLGNGACDEIDLVQELLARVVRRLQAFDAQVGHLYPFIATIVDRETAKLVRSSRAGKRAGGRIDSLNAMVRVESEGMTTLSQTISEREVDRRTGRERQLSQVELSDLRLDLERLMAELPEPWQQMLEHCKTYNMAEVSQIMGIPRSTLGDWMRQVRQKFEEAGLEAYFQN